MADVLAIFEQLSSSVAGEKFVAFSIRLEKPSRLNYTIRGFLHERKHTEPHVFAKKLESLMGVDSNFEYELHGHVEYPDEFKGMSCELMVNPLAGSEYFKYVADGLVGDGWFENSRFVFRLYVSPEIAKNILERRILAEKIEEDFAWDEMDDEEEHGRTAWMKVRVDAVNCDRPDHNADVEVCFNLIRVYC